MKTMSVQKRVRKTRIWMCNNFINRRCVIKERRRESGARNENGKNEIVLVKAFSYDMNMNFLETLKSFARF